jgi:hypothetical protein
VTTRPPQRALSEVEVLARIHTPKAVQTLVDIMGDESAAPAARVTAANSILDRGWGKSKQTVVLDPGTEHLSDEDLERHVQQRIDLVAARLAGGREGGSGAGEGDSGDAATQGAPVSSRLVH